MAIDAISMDEYVFVSETDTGEPKTKFYMKPMLDFEYLTYSGKFAEVTDSMSLEDEGKLMKFFSGEHGEDFKSLLIKFINEKVAKIENIKVKGEYKTFKNGEFNVGIINLTTCMEILADAVSRVFISEEEEKN